jgi:hypothetical protein
MGRAEERGSGCFSRRAFLGRASAIAAGVPAAAGAAGTWLQAGEAPPPPAPARKEPAVVKVGFLRNPAPLSGGWPGHGFNNDVACKEYAEKLGAMGRGLGVAIDLDDAGVPFTDEAAVDRFIAAVQAKKPDALILCPIGIFTPWKKAGKILEAIRLPTLIFSQIGTSFTMNTSPLASRRSTPGIRRCRSTSSRTAPEEGPRFPLPRGRGARGHPSRR